MELSAKIGPPSQNPRISVNGAVHAAQPAKTTHSHADVPRAIAVFLVIFAVYFISYSRTLPSTADEMVDYGLAQSIAKWQIFSIDQVSTVGPGPNQFGLGEHRYSKFGPLQPLLSVPLFWLAQHLPIGTVDTVLLLNHLVSALSVAILYLLVRRLGYRPAVALIVVGLAAFGTPLWVHAKRYFSEPTITLAVVATVYCAYAAATTRRPIWLVLTGLALGAAVAAKYVDALVLIPVPLYLAWTALRPRGLPSFAVKAPHSSELLVSRPGQAGALAATLLPFAAGALPVAVALLLYNVVRFGSALHSGYADGETFSVPIWVGVPGLLWSPGKSIFVYTPAFLLLAIWGRSFARRFSTLTWLVGSIVVLHFVVFGTWIAWWGAWSWGPRFLVPIMPLLALLLAEGIATARSTAIRIVALALGAASVAIQILGIAVDHDVYIATLFPLDLLPDTVTIWDIRYQPIVHQIPYLNRGYLDFAWIERSGPSFINGTALWTAVVAAIMALAGGAVVWRARTRTVRLAALIVAALVVSGAVYRDLRIYGQSDDPAILAIAQALAAAPADTAVVQLIPSAIVPYDSWQKRPLPELGWIEEASPSPLILRRLASFERWYPRLWVVTETDPKVPSNGIEAALDRSLVQVGNDPIGRYRLLRYATNPTALPIVSYPRHFGDGIDLVGYVAGERMVPGRPFDLTLVWRGSDAAVRRPDYTVFVHVLGPDGALVAQRDDPPASGYASTSSWQPAQTVYDDHAIAIPTTAPSDLHLVEIGLYSPSTGQRVPVLDGNGVADGDAVRLDLAH